MLGRSCAACPITILEFIGRGLLALVAPPSCRLCDVGLFTGLLCVPCDQSLRELRLPSGRDRFKLGLGPDYPSLDVRCHSAYVGPVKSLIHQLKFQNRLESAEPLGQGLRELVSEDLMDFDIVCPLPTHFRRWLTRSYNPAALLAEQVVLHSGLPSRRALSRRPGQAPQSTLPLDEREVAPHGLFQVDRRQRDLIQGGRVLLVDDVTTTGATLAAAASALYDGGAEWVEAMAFARVLPGVPDLMGVLSGGGSSLVGAPGGDGAPVTCL